MPNGEQWRSWLRQYKLVLVLAVVGLVLVAWPTQRTATSSPDTQGQEAEEESFSVEELEQRLAQAISRIQGAGDATVLCDGEDGEEVVLLTQYYPSFRGALVVCPGGDDPQVQLAITQAVSALTGLGSDRITICAGD